MKNKPDPFAEVEGRLFIGKWTVRILFLLKERPHRHGQLRQRLGTVSQRMLTKTLRNLEATGMISKTGKDDRDPWQSNIPLPKVARHLSSHCIASAAGAVVTARD